MGGQRTGVTQSTDQTAYRDDLVRTKVEPGRSCLWRYLPAHGEGGPQLVRYVVQDGIGQRACRIEHFAEEAPGSSRKNDVEHVVIGEPEVAEFIDVLLRDLLGLLGDLAREPDDSRVGSVKRLGRLVSGDAS